MGNVWGRLVADHPYYIKPYGFVEQIVAGQIEECRATDLLLLSEIYSLRWMAESGVFSGFDLNEHIGTAIFADNINFAAFPPIISGFNTKTFGAEMLDGDIFASFTEVYPLLRQILLLL